MIQVVTTGRLNGAQLPPYIDGGVMTHLSGGGTEGCRFDADVGGLGPDGIRRATVPVRAVLSGVAGGGSGQRAILALPDGLVCNLDQVAVGLGGVDKGAKAAQTAYAVRAYASVDGQVVGLMAVQSGTAPVLPTGTRWQSPILAVLVTDGAGAVKPFVDLRGGRQYCNEDDGNGNLGWLVLTGSQGAGNVQLTLQNSNGGQDPGAVEGITGCLLGILLQGGGAASAVTYVADPVSGSLIVAQFAVATGETELHQVRFYPADQLASGVNLEVGSPAAAGAALDVLVQELMFGW